MTWFKSASIYSLTAPMDGADLLAERLAPLAFEPGSSIEMQRLGWVPPREGGALVHAVGEHYLIALRSEKKLLPSSVVNQVAKAKAQEIEEQQGYKPGRKQMREIKEAVTDELLPRAFALRRDTLNAKDDAEFFRHFGFLITEMYRVLQPGRLMAVHCMNLPTSKANDGFIGIKDFRGDLIRAFRDAGFIYHSEVCIWKDPVVAMQRTKALGLLHKQIKKDSSLSRQGIADYLVVMRKPGENEHRIEGEIGYYVGSEPPAGFRPIERSDGSEIWVVDSESATNIDTWQRYRERARRAVRRRVSQYGFHVGADARHELRRWRPALHWRGSRFRFSKRV